MDSSNENNLGAACVTGGGAIGSKYDSNNNSVNNRPEESANESNPASEGNLGHQGQREIPLLLTGPETDHGASNVQNASDSDASSSCSSMSLCIIIIIISRVF
jgi:hypothetical protein